MRLQQKAHQIAVGWDDCHAATPASGHKDMLSELLYPLVAAWWRSSAYTARHHTPGKLVAVLTDAPDGSLSIPLALLRQLHLLPTMMHRAAHEIDSYNNQVAPAFRASEVLDLQDALRGTTLAPSPAASCLAQCEQYLGYMTQRARRISPGSLPHFSDVMAQLHVGAALPDTFDAGTYSRCTTTPCLASDVDEIWTTAGDEFDANTIFKVIDDKGRELTFANTLSTVQFDGFSFRNPPHMVKTHQTYLLR